MSRSFDPDTLFHAMAGQVLMDAWIESTAAYWERRARTFEWVLTGDPRTTPTAEQLAARPDIADIIRNCRHRATLTDAARAEYLETLHALALGAAA